MIMLLLLWFMTNRFLSIAIHDTNCLTTYELLFERDLEEITREEAEFVREKSQYPITTKGARRSRTNLPKRVNATIYCAIKAQHLDIAWDDEHGHYKNGHRMRDDKKHTSHGSKGQANARWNTRAYAMARKLKNAYLLEYEIN